MHTEASDLLRLECLEIIRHLVRLECLEIKRHLVRMECLEIKRHLVRIEYLEIKRSFLQNELLFLQRLVSLDCSPKAASYSAVDAQYGDVLVALGSFRGKGEGGWGKREGRGVRRVCLRARN